MIVILIDHAVKAHFNLAAGGDGQNLGSGSAPTTLDLPYDGLGGGVHVHPAGRP